MPMKLNIGDIVQTKKNHPCGHETWISRVKLEKAIKKIIQSAEPEDTNK